MGKKQALQILIQNTYLLDEKIKMNLLAHIDELTNEEIDVIGKFLAIEKKIAIESAQETIEKVEEVAKELRNELDRISPKTS